MNNQSTLYNCDYIQQDLMSSYVNGILPAENSRMVQEHISGCEHCAAEYLQVKQLISDMSNMDEEDMALEQLLSIEAKENSLDRMFAQIDADNASRLTAGELSQQEGMGDNKKQGAVFSRSTALNQFKAQWQGVPQLIKHIFLAQTAVLSLFLLVMVGNWGVLLYDQSANGIVGQANYRTLTSEGGQSSAVPRGMHIFRIMFHPKATETDIRELMTSLNAQLTAGPSLSGVYSVAISSSTDREKVLRAMRSSTWIEFAEPVVHLSRP